MQLDRFSIEPELTRQAGPTKAVEARPDEQFWREVFDAARHTESDGPNVRPSNDGARTRPPSQPAKLEPSSQRSEHHNTSLVDHKPRTELGFNHVMSVVSSNPERNNRNATISFHPERFGGRSGTHGTGHAAESDSAGRGARLTFESSKATSSKLNVVITESAEHQTKKVFLRGQLSSKQALELTSMLGASGQGELTAAFLNGKQIYGMTTADNEADGNHFKA